MSVKEQTETHLRSQRAQQSQIATYPVQNSTFRKVDPATGGTLTDTAKYRSLELAAEQAAKRWGRGIETQREERGRGCWQGGHKRVPRASALLLRWPRVIHAIAGDCRVKKRDILIYLPPNNRINIGRLYTGFWLRLFLLAVGSSLRCRCSPPTSGLSGISAIGSHDWRVLQQLELHRDSIPRSSLLCYGGKWAGRCRYIICNYFMREHSESLPTSHGLEFL